MKRGIVTAILTLCGFGAGFGTGWFVVKSKYDAKVMAEAEIEAKKAAEKQEKEEKDIKAPLPKNDDKALNYFNNLSDEEMKTLKKVTDESEVTVTTTEGEEDEEEEEEEYDDLDRPEFIDEEEMNLYPFDHVEALFYFEGDCVLTDMHYNVLDNYEENIGLDNYVTLDTMAKNVTSGTILWIVNEKYETFYKIIVKRKTFASIAPSLTSEEDDDEESY